MTQTEFIQLVKEKLQEVGEVNSNDYIIDSRYWTTTVA